MRIKGVSIGFILVIGFLFIANSTQIVEVSSINALDPIPSNNIDELVQSLDTQLIWQNLGQIGNLETDFYCEFESGFVCFNMGQVEIWTANDQSPILLNFTRMQQTHPIGVRKAIPVSNFFLGDRGTFTGVKSYHTVEYRNSEVDTCIRFIPITTGFRLDIVSDANLEELVTVSNPTKLDIQLKSHQMDEIESVISYEDSEISQRMVYEFTSDSIDSVYASLPQLESFFTPVQSGINFTYSTYLGGSALGSSEYSYDIDVDSDDNVYLCGRTTSSDFPILNEYDSSLGGARDSFISKFSPNGDLLYSTYIGGSSYDASSSASIALDAVGNIYLAVDTLSSDFPTVNAIDSSYNGEIDVAICKLNSTGDSLIYSTYLGSSTRDMPRSIAVRSDGSVIVVGYTWGNYPTVNTGVLDSSGNDAGFVSRLSPNGTELIFSGLIAANGDVVCEGVSVDDDGYIYITSLTYASDFPVVNAYDSTLNGVSDATVMKLHPNASSIEYSTYVGGSGEENTVTDIDIDADGNVYVLGRTYSEDFPTVKAFDTTHGWGDIYVFRLNASGQSLDFSSYLGGEIINDNEFPYGIIVNDYGYAYVASMTTAIDFPIVHPIDDTIEGEEIIVTKIDTNQGRIVYSTYIGGSDDESAFGAITLDSMDNVIVCSATYSSDFPTINAYDSTLTGTLDLTVTKIPPLGDSDNDAIFDLDENIYGTDPYNNDTDYDLMADGYEVQYGLDPLLNDSMDDLDNDTLTNLEEFNLGTNPNSSDSDNDTLDDAFEVLYGINPLSPDTDNDTMGDAYEVQYGLDPLLNDTIDDLDNDTLTNLEEFNLGTNPSSPDSDNDTLGDAYEVHYGLDPLLNDSMDDLDNDTLTNLEEFNLGTNPNSSDSDNDTLDDAYEVNELGTNPLSSDSDSDGYSDSYEVENGFDPLDPNDPPETTEPTDPTDTTGLTDTSDPTDTTSPTDITGPTNMIYYLSIGIIGGITVVTAIVIWKVFTLRREH